MSLSCRVESSFAVQTFWVLLCGCDHSHPPLPSPAWSKNKENNAYTKGPPYGVKNIFHISLPWVIGKAFVYSTFPRHGRKLPIFSVPESFPADPDVKKRVHWD